MIIINEFVELIPYISLTFLAETFVDLATGFAFAAATVLSFV